MKKLIVFALVLTMVFSVNSVFAAGQSDFKVKLGLDTGTITNDTSSSNEAIDMGLSLCGEYITPYSNDLSIGTGIEFQFDRNFSDLPNKFNFTPVYGLFKLNTADNVFLTGKLGYNFFNFADISNTEGGLYYGFGGGMKISDSIECEVIYSINNGKLEGDNINFSRLGIFLGTSF